MDSYPRDLIEFERQFCSEDACLEYLRQIRWCDGFLCPGCGGARSWRVGKGLDEYTFRFNRRNSKARGLLFYRLLQQAVMIVPVTYKELVGGKEQGADLWGERH